jgi:hypothetical protein
MGNGMDGFEEMFLEDLGIGTDALPAQEGELMASLPARRGQKGVARRTDTDLTGFSPAYTTRRFNPHEQLIIEKIREGALTQEGIATLSERATALSGEERVNTALRLKGEVQNLLLIKDIAYAENTELGEMLEPVVKRMIHDRTNGALGLNNMTEEIYAREIERAYTDIESAPRRRTFWDSVLGRK